MNACQAINGNVFGVFMKRHACYKLLIILVALIMCFNYTLPMGTTANTRLFKNKYTNIYSSVGLCNEEAVCLIWSGPEHICNI